MKTFKQLIVPTIFTLLAIVAFLYIGLGIEKNPLLLILGFAIAFIIQMIGFEINNVIFEKEFAFQNLDGEKK